MGRRLYITQWLAEHEKLRWPAEMLAHGARVLADEMFEEFCEELPERKGDLVLDALAF